MKRHVHPKYGAILASCSCGNVMQVKSTLDHDIALDVCDVCHPFYTGTQRIIDTKGRVNLFNRRFSMRSDSDSMFTIQK